VLSSFIDQLVLLRELSISFLELVHNDIAGHLKEAKCAKCVEHGGLGGKLT